jgi:hypothetical protein
MKILSVVRSIGRSTFQVAKTVVIFPFKVAKAVLTLPFIAVARARKQIIAYQFEKVVASLKGTKLNIEEKSKLLETNVYLAKYTISQQLELWAIAIEYNIQSGLPFLKQTDTKPPESPLVSSSKNQIAVDAQYLAKNQPMKNTAPGPTFKFPSCPNLSQIPTLENISKLSPKQQSKFVTNAVYSSDPTADILAITRAVESNAIKVELCTLKRMYEKAHQKVTSTVSEKNYEPHCHAANILIGIAADLDNVTWSYHSAKRQIPNHSDSKITEKNQLIMGSLTAVGEKLKNNADIKNISESLSEHYTVLNEKYTDLTQKCEALCKKESEKNLPEISSSPSSVALQKI